MDFIQKTISEHSYSESAKQIIFHTFKAVCAERGVPFGVSGSGYTIKAATEEQHDQIREEIIKYLKEEGF